MSGLDKLRLSAGWLILGVWTASLVIDVLIPAYSPPPTIHALMLLVAGALFGPTITGRSKEKEKE